MAVRGLDKLKVQKNDAEVSQLGDTILIKFDNSITVDGQEVRDFELIIPTLKDMEIASSGLSDVNNVTIINNLLSNLLTPKIPPNDFEKVFTLKEHGVLNEVISSFL